MYTTFFINLILLKIYIYLILCLAGGKGIHRPLSNTSGKGKMNKHINNKVQNEKQVSNKKNKAKKANGNVRPFSYTSFNNYGTSNKKKRKRN